MPSTATSNGRTSKTHWLGFFVAYNVTQVACLCAHDDGECQAKILFFHMFTFSMKYIHTLLKGVASSALGSKNVILVMLECCQKAGLYAFQTVFTMFVVLLLEGCGTGFQLLDGFSRRLRVHLFP